MIQTQKDVEIYFFQNLRMQMFIMYSLTYSNDINIQIEAIFLQFSINYICEFQKYVTKIIVIQYVCKYNVGTACGQEKRKLQNLKKLAHHFANHK